MERDSIKHSAEGTHWQKKNHKYIRKEGNRYIYPSDLKRLESTAEKRQNAVNNQGSTDYKKIGSDRAKRRRAAGVPDELIVKNYRQAYPEQYAKEVSAHKKNYRKAVESTNELKRSNATYQQNSQDYKKLSKQKANRTAAASGKVVNPGYVIKGSDGKVLGRGNTNRNYVTPTTADYKEYSQLTAGHKNRRKNLSKQGSTDYKELSKQQAQKTNRANAANGARGTFEKGHMSDQDYQKKYYERQVVANRRKRAAGSGQNKGQTYAKNTAHEGKFRAERLLAEKERNRKKEINSKINQITSEYSNNSEIAKKVKTASDYEKEARRIINEGKRKGSFKNRTLASIKRTVDKGKAFLSRLGKKKEKVNNVKVKPIETERIEVEPIETERIEVEPIEVENIETENIIYGGNNRKKRKRKH